MDFSNNAFQTRPPTTLSEDNIGHAKLVQSCRFGWSTGPSDTQETSSACDTPTLTSSHTTTLVVSTQSDRRAKRLTPCRGRFYHQLTCSHRIRTDLIEDCGINCLEPYVNNSPTDTATNISPIPFYCQECVDAEATRIWDTRTAEHDSQYPPMNRMTADEYNRWYEEHRALQARYAMDRKAYEMQQRAGSRPTNVCSALEMSKEEEAFARELDGLSLSLMAASSSSSPSESSTSLASSIHNDTANLADTTTTPAAAGPQRRPSHPHLHPYHPYHRQRVSLPSDASEQLHWGLHSLAIDRGSCGVEYSAGASSPAQTPTKQRQVSANMDEGIEGLGRGTEVAE